MVLPTRAGKDPFVEGFQWTFRGPFFFKAVKETVKSTSSMKVFIGKWWKMIRYGRKTAQFLVPVLSLENSLAAWKHDIAAYLISSYFLNLLWKFKLSSHLWDSYHHGCLYTWSMMKDMWRACLRPVICISIMYAYVYVYVYLYLVHAFAKWHKCCLLYTSDAADE